MATVVCVIFGSALAAAGCGGQASSGGSEESGGGDSTGGGGKLAVVASTTQVGDFVRNVGGEAIEEHQVLAPNSDPHEYEPRPEDVRQTAGAEVVFVSGDELDSWMSDIVSESGGDPEVVDLAEGLPEQLPGEEEEHEGADHEGEEGHEHEGEYDPHWWHDPTNVEAAVGEIRNALVEADPDSQEVYERNAKEYTRKVKTLDSDIRACMEKVPAGERKLVTDHDAFGYFANRYDINVVGAVIPSQSTQAQPSAKETSDLVALINRENVKAVFPESSINPKLARTIARETGATSEYTLYGDTLGPKGADGETYLGMEAANAGAMVGGFTGGQESCDISAGEGEG